MTNQKRVDIKAILADPCQRRELMVRCIIAIQAREGITTTRAQAVAAYDKALSPADRLKLPAIRRRMR